MNQPDSCTALYEIERMMERAEGHFNIIFRKVYGNEYDPSLLYGVRPVSSLIRDYIGKVKNYAAESGYTLPEEILNRIREIEDKLGGIERDGYRRGIENLLLYAENEKSAYYALRAIGRVMEYLPRTDYTPEEILKILNRIRRIADRMGYHALKYVEEEYLKEYLEKYQGMQI